MEIPDAVGISVGVSTLNISLGINPVLYVQTILQPLTYSSHAEDGRDTLDTVMRLNALERSIKSYEEVVAD